MGRKVAAGCGDDSGPKGAINPTQPMLAATMTAIAKRDRLTSSPILSESVIAVGASGTQRRTDRPVLNVLSASIASSPQLIVCLTTQRTRMPPNGVPLS
jgi:hypothetical protein